MKRLAVLITIVMAFVVASLAVAQALPGDNDPRFNRDANSCYEGGLFEGKCGDNPNMWRAGWYHIRLEYGFYTPNQLPADVRWVSRPYCNDPADPDPFWVALEDRCVPTGRYYNWWR